MDLGRHLADVDRHIAASEERVARQTARVAELEMDGRDVRNARDLLRLMHNALQLMLEHRAIVMRHLSMTDWRVTPIGMPRYELIIRRASLTVSDFVTGDANGQAQPIQIVFSILANSPMFRSWNQDRRDLPQLLDNRLRIF